MPTPTGEDIKRKATEFFMAEHSGKGLWEGGAPPVPDNRTLNEGRYNERARKELMSEGGNLSPEDRQRARERKEELKQQLSEIREALGESRPPRARSVTRAAIDKSIDEALAAAETRPRPPPEVRAQPPPPPPPLPAAAAPPAARPQPQPRAKGPGVFQRLRSRVSNSQILRGEIRRIKTGPVASELKSLRTSPGRTLGRNAMTVGRHLYQSGVESGFQLLGGKRETTVTRGLISSLEFRTFARSNMEKNLRQGWAYVANAGPDAVVMSRQNPKHGRPYVTTETAVTEPGVFKGSQRKVTVTREKAGANWIESKRNEQTMERPGFLTERPRIDVNEAREVARVARYAIPRPRMTFGLTQEQQAYYEARRQQLWTQRQRQMAALQRRAASGTFFRPTILRADGFLGRTDTVITDGGFDYLGVNRFAYQMSTRGPLSKPVFSLGPIISNGYGGLSPRTRQAVFGFQQRGACIGQRTNVTGLPVTPMMMASLSYGYRRRSSYGYRRPAVAQNSRVQIVRTTIVSRPHPIKLIPVPQNGKIAFVPEKRSR